MPIPSFDQPALLPASPAKGGVWNWLRQYLGLDGWLRRVRLTTRGGQQERVYLRLSLLTGNRRVGSGQLLESAWHDFLPIVRVGGGEVEYHQDQQVVLHWPAEAESWQVPAVQAYFQLRHCLHRLCPAAVGALCGAASIGWVRPLPHALSARYQGSVLAEVAGMLGEAQQLGGGLLISAALRQRLPDVSSLSHSLHVAFNLPGHRQPATLYRTESTPPGPPQNQR